MGVEPETRGACQTSRVACVFLPHGADKPDAGLRRGLWGVRREFIRPGLASGEFSTRRHLWHRLRPMSVRRPALPRAARLFALCLLIPACGAHPPASAPEKQAPQALSAGTSPAPVPASPVPEVSSQVVAAAVVPMATPVVTPEPKPTASAAGGLTPLSASQRATLLAGAEDTLVPTPIHYVKSNEVRHDVWFPYVRGRGGAYLGVGSDQNYTVAGAARSELMFLSDIDRSVVDLHRVYEVLIEASETPELLLGRFEEAAASESRGLLEAAFAGLPEPERRRLVRLYGAARETVLIHLRHVIKRKQGETATTWLSDPAMYAHIRALFQADRVRAMGGDLTGTNSLQTAAAAARELGVPFGVIYFSNAEEYFDYSKSFIANIEAFPLAEGAVLLRTIYNKQWVHADQLWAYQVQPLADFKARLGNRKNRSRNPMLRYADLEGALNKETGTKGLSLVALAVAPG